MTPGQEPFGKEAFAQQPAGKLLDGSADVRELKVLGDWAFVCTYIDVRLEPDASRGAGKPTRYNGWTLTLLQKGADGRWRIARDANLVSAQR
jgi:ketosteroid isomerase-like protein